MPPLPHRLVRLVPALPVLAALALLGAGCGGLPGKKSKTPALNVPLDWNLPGTMVVYMPKQVSSAKQLSGDPLHANWADALMGYVDESQFVQRIIDQGKFLSPEVHISSKTVPSSDYSVLLIGAKGRAVHVQEPWQSAELFLLLDDYLRGKGSAGNLPPGCEAITVRVPKPKEPAEPPAGEAGKPALPEKPETPAAPATEPAEAASAAGS